MSGPRMSQDCLDRLARALEDDLRASAAAPTLRARSQPPPARPGWHALVPRDVPDAQGAAGIADVPLPWTGFHPLRVVAVRGVLLVLFTWDETPDETYMLPMDVSEERHATAATVDVLAMNVLERLGAGWWRRARLVRTGGIAVVGDETVAGEFPS